jgi:hypothetical protein
MVHIILKILTIVFLCYVNPVFTQEIWREDFSTSEKGIWADEEGILHSDFSDITQWSLEYDDVQLENSTDYAKTVTTSGGRFEVRDINGEVIWRSEWIDIRAHDKVKVELTASETGSGANTGTKYLKAYYRLDDNPEAPFHENSENLGNWGSHTVVAGGLTGELLQIVCLISTHYSTDKVILDDISIRKDTGPLPPVEPHDVVINELMPDPAPPVNLPAEEYIELLNTGDFPVSTNNWLLRINGVEKKIQNTIIEPHGYLLLCATGSLESLQPFGNVSNVPGFQGLLNLGALVEILDDKGNIIDRIAYADTWCNDTQKKDGGWSLERIDPFRYCNQKENWEASLHPDGGTPCKENSVFSDNPDLIPPYVKWAVPVSENEIELVFSEPVDTFLLKNCKNFMIAETGNPVDITRISDTKTLLHFEGSFQMNEVYTLEIKNLTDECGNPLFQNQFVIQRNTIEPGDVLINELLFNPFPGGEDYVEIYNPSEKLIDLNRLSLATRNKELEPDRISLLTEERKILYPENYLVLTRDTHAVFPWYLIPHPECFLQMEQMPPFPNTEGHVVLLNEEMQIIDEFYYHEEMHSPFLADVEGIALERVSFSLSTNAPGNWQSASSGSGYGTPGYENSQGEGPVNSEPLISFEPGAFSPDFDGYNDDYIIRYELNKPGYVTNIKIFDAAGRFVQHLAKNEILGTRGKIVWNGQDETGHRQPFGVYVILMEIFNANGEIYRVKSGVVLTGFPD